MKVLPFKRRTSKPDHYWIGLRDAVNKATFDYLKRFNGPDVREWRGSELMGFLLAGVAVSSFNLLQVAKSNPEDLELTIMEIQGTLKKGIDLAREAAQ
jgi:hypothetical protein